MRCDLLFDVTIEGTLKYL